MGVSPRYVQLLFENEGTTFSEFLLWERLVRAHRMLTDPLHAERTITALALKAGFGDLSYFNRAFRRRYGASPTEVREAARKRQQGADEQRLGVGHHSPRPAGAGYD